MISWLFNKLARFTGVIVIHVMIGVLIWVVLGVFDIV